VSRVVLISPSPLPYSSAISDVTLCFTPFKKCYVLRVRVRVRVRVHVRTRVGGVCVRTRVAGQYVPRGSLSCCSIDSPAL
jgi:hypothetical protein